MSYGDRETSVEGAAPYELYQFTSGSATWAFTTAESTVSYLAVDYLPSTASRDAILQNGEQQSNSVVFSMPRDEAVLAPFLSAIAPQPVAVTIFRNQRGLDSTETLTIFLGEVSHVEWQDSVARVTCTSLESAFTIPLNRVHVQITCPWMTYDGQCGLNADDFSATGTLAEITGATFTVHGLPSVDPDSTYYVNGVLLAGGIRSLITGQSGSSGAYDLTVFAAPAVLPDVGSAIVVTAGDPHTAAVCHSRFNNIARFGGFPFMPARSPWERIV